MKRVIALSLVLVMALSVLVACGGKGGSGDSGNLIGSWSATEEGVEVIFTFKDGGKGTMSSMGIEMDMTWSTDGDKINMSMSFMGETEEMSGTYKIEGNKLSLTADGETLVLTKK